MANAEKVICCRCHKAIRGFTARSDWESRRLHLKCWKEQKDDEQCRTMMEEFLKMNPHLAVPTPTHP